MKKLTLCVLTLIVWMVAACSASNPTLTTREFVMAMSQGDADRALQYMHIPEDEHYAEHVTFVKEVLLPPVMRRMNTLALNKGGVAQVLVEQIHYDGDKASVRYILLYGNGERLEETLSLQKFSNWRVIR